MAVGLLSLIVAAIFFGAAFYVSVVEQPARLSLDDRAALAEWNDELVATEADKAGPPSRALLVRWGSLHAVRTAFGAVAVIAFLSACLSG